MGNIPFHTDAFVVGGLIERSARLLFVGQQNAAARIHNAAVAVFKV
jgi:hypothetical protein